MIWLIYLETPICAMLCFSEGVENWENEHAIFNSRTFYSMRIDSDITEKASDIYGIKSKGTINHSTTKNQCSPRIQRSSARSCIKNLTIST